MAGTSLLALIDDIASTLDDVALMTKVAAKKTAGVLGDDLALNAQQVAGVNADRELPVVFAVAKGSALNKAILVPLALGISFFAPVIVTPLLMIGGLYLCYEGFGKVFEKIFHSKNLVSKKDIPQNESIQEFESQKVKGAIRTDFVLSAEIIVITLGTVTEFSFLKQFLTLVGISALMTVGVYGLVAVIVKMDDLGFYMSRPYQEKYKQKIGVLILSFAPVLMKFLGIAGTVAMFLVGGGIISHGIPFLHHLSESSMVFGILVNLLTGVVSGGMTLLLILGSRKVRKLI